MKKFLRKYLSKYLSLDDDFIALHRHLNELNDDFTHLFSGIDKLNHNVRTHNRALGHILAKLDPILGVSEDDPGRRAASDKLGDEIIKRMSAEVAATNRSR